MTSIFKKQKNNENKINQVSSPNVKTIKNQYTEEKEEYSSAEAKKKNIDFNSLNKGQLVDTCVELILKLKETNSLLKKYELEAKESFVEIKKQRKTQDSIINKVRILATKLSPTYISENINATSKSLNIDQIINMISKDYLEEKKAHQSRLIEVESDLKSTHALIQQLHFEFEKSVQYQNEEPEVKDIIEAKNNDSSGGTAKIDEDGVVVEDETIPDELFEKTTESLTTAQTNKVGIAFADFGKIKAKCGETELQILKLIGEKGLSLYSDIETEIIKLGGTKSKIEKAYNTLKGLSVIECLDGDNSLKTMLRKGGVRVLWLSKSIGVTFYIDTFKKKPVMSEQAMLIKENDNLVHGYSIKETSEVLADLGYKDISYRRKNNTIDLGAGKQYIPDIIARNPVTNQSEFFEIEYGTQTKEDYGVKITKANMKGNVLRIITPTSKKKAMLIFAVEQWLKAKKNSVTLEISICRFDEMKKKSWGEVYK